MCHDLSSRDVPWVLIKLYHVSSDFDQDNLMAGMNLRADDWVCWQT